MSFAWPQLLWLLLAPLGLLVWEVSHRRQAAAAAHPKILRAQAGTHALKLAPSESPAAPGRGHLRPWLCAGLALALVALARPQWGRLEEPVFDQSREILLAVDLSRSMLTPDVKPSRLDRTKLLIQSLLEKLAGERVGLVVFSGTAFLQAPLSADYEILREFLPALSPAFLPEGGTNYGAMLDTSVQAFGATNAADRFLIVLSDGEATDTDWKSRLEDLKKKSIRVLGLGVGTAGGGMIPDGSGGFVKDERGAVVLSKLESNTLQELARASDGTYRDASSWIDLAGLINATIAAGRKGEFVEKNTVRLVERFQWPLALGLWCLLVSFYYEFPVRPKPRAITLHPPEKRMKPHVPTASVLILLVSLAGLFPAPARAAAKLASPPASAPTASNPAAPGEPSVLSKIVGRLAAAEERTARDWAELGRETVNWGSRLQSQQQAIPEIPVRDALSAVDLGEKLDAQATDWPKLRSELEALLQKPDDQKQQDKNKQDKKSNKDQKQEKQDKDQQSQDQKSEDQQQEQQQSQSDDQKSEQKQSSSSQPEKPDEKKPQGESAFGDMQKKDERPPPPPENMQQVGGAPEKKENPANERIDPALAMPMQKLEQLRNQDSPAQLFQLMEGPKQPAKKTSKDW